MNNKCIKCGGVGTIGIGKCYCAECFGKAMSHWNTEKARIAKWNKDNPNFMRDHINRSWYGSLVFFGVMFVVAIILLSFGN